MKSSILRMLVAAAALSGLGVYAQSAAFAAWSSAPLEPALQQAIHECDAAQVHGDRAALERLVAVDYVIVRPRGLGDRASLIDGMTHPGSKLQPFTLLKPFTRNCGDTVVIGGRVALHGIDGLKPFEEKFRFSDVWSKRSGRWYVVMTQLTPSDAP